MAATALITGAGGLIGRHVVAAWDIEGLEPFGPEIDGRRPDLLQEGAARDAVLRARPAVVVHLAWVASGTPSYRTSSDNDRWVDATLELVAASFEVGALFVGTGTPVELEAVAEGDRYAAAKAAVRHQLEPRIDASEIAWLQPFYVFDPGLRRPAVVADALIAADEGRPVLLRTPDVRHDFVHVADVARGVVESVRARLTGVVPLGSGATHSVGELVTALGAAWEPAHDAHARPQTSSSSRPADTTRIRSTGWRPTTTQEYFHDV